MTDRYKKNRMDLSHEIWAAAQLAPGEGIADGVARTEAILRRAIHSAITHCDNCGCSWLDDGVNPIGCPYCEKIDWRAVNTELLPLPVGEASSFGNYEVHDNEAMVAYARANIARAVAPLQAEIEALRAEVGVLKTENERLRKDAERYRCLSSMATQQADYLGPIFRIDVRRSEPYLFNFDAAVDAMLKAREDNND